MAKMTREKLKGIVKECLVEILSEGLNTKAAGIKPSVSKKRAQAAEEKRLADEERLRIKNLQLKIAESVTFAVTKKGYYEGQYGYPKNITFSFSFKNKTNRDIAGIKGKLTFFDMFDEKITVINLSYDDGIRANKIAVYKAQIDYNDFESDDKKLRDTELTKLKHLWEPEQLIFSDGEKLAL